MPGPSALEESSPLGPALTQLRSVSIIVSVRSDAQGGGNAREYGNENLKYELPSFLLHG